jgi:hypothetical protein
VLVPYRGGSACAGEGRAPHRAGPRPPDRAVILIDGEVIGGHVELAKMASSGELHHRQEKAEAAQGEEPGLRRAGS